MRNAFVHSAIYGVCVKEEIFVRNIDNILK
ncbi:hypothetical protein HNQ38_001712 [Desulfovibrio intestinalis]|uniref:Uncharacterized protein n=1 Tax=Desulfovibrio intestinalis TaxID=58621 RepID=A0A7W8FGB6_9BACT|nr:hypothetical protein [Desulfovibrio intestinalis]